MPKSTKPATLGQLRESGYQVLPVKQEMRQNLMRKMRDGEEIFPGIVGYEETVLPQIENAILSGQDIVLLGERGQAKTRIARNLITLLDDVEGDTAVPSGRAAYRPDHTRRLVRQRRLECAAITKHWSPPTRARDQIPLERAPAQSL